MIFKPLIKKNQIFNWINFIILSIITFIGFILYLIYIYQSNKNVFDLVTDKYYEEELTYQNEINAYKRAILLNNIPTYIIKKEGIIIQFPKEFLNSKVNILLQHPYIKTLDIQFNTLLKSNNNILIPTKFLIPTIYLLKIKWKNKNLNYRKDYEIKWK